MPIDHDELYKALEEMFWQNRLARFGLSPCQAEPFSRDDRASEAAPAPPPAVPVCRSIPMSCIERFKRCLRKAISCRVYERSARRSVACRI